MKPPNGAAESGEDSENENQRNVLTAAKASEFCPKHYRLIAKRNALTHLDDISALSSLDYVDLTGNQLTSLSGLRNNRKIKTLIVRENKLSDLTPILKLSALRVLNIAGNQIVSTDWLVHAAFAGELLTLIANGNEIKDLEGLSCLRTVKTLVLSHNCIENMAPVTALSSLTKLSLSNNEIRSIPESIKRLRNLSELRLAHNLISSLPAKEVLSSLTWLKIVDLGHNRISSFEELGFTGNNIVNLNVRNNPAATKEDFTEDIREYCPKVEIIDGTRVIGGRRKLRINRLRIAAGFPIEKDRRFARPPPKQVLDRLQRDDKINPDDDKRQRIEDGKDLDKHEGEISPPSGNATSGSGDNSVSTRKRKLLGVEGNEEDPDECIEPSELIAQARAHVLEKGASEGLPRACLQVQSKHTSKQKRKKRRRRDPGKAGVVESDFGTGGTSTIAYLQQSA
ncbi:hypothetical protein FGB62_327g06 [Gracilaria domingensis]|nr:hypothetical protein FGB62_327g06 [Gracilaria domingensis]